MRQALTFSILSVAILSSVAGCERPEDPMLKVLESTALQTRVDDLSRTVDFVFSDRQFDQTKFNGEVSTGLNRWANYSAEQFEKTNWKQDETIKEMIAPYDDLPAVSRMGESSFLADDAQFLQAAAWLNQIKTRVQDNTYLGQFEFYRLMADNYEPGDDEEAPVDAVIAKLNPDLNESDAEKLSLAIKLFDWVTRNVQLEETPTYSEEEIEEQRLVEADSLSAAGLVSRGAKRTVWQVLMFARGDYVEKAKLFMQLCHQADLPTVMFGTGDNAEPWAVGVLIGEDWFLFDTRLGLPIPGENNASVATLADVKADASLLSKLDLSVEESLADDTKYWTTESDLEKLTGLVFWTPQSASNRIATLESNLIGDQRMKLKLRADEIIAKLPKIENVEYKPWNISLQTARYRKVLGESIPKAVSDDALAEKLRWHFTEEGYIMAFPNYRTARTRFIRGKFERERESRTRDSIESFAVLMYEDQTIAGLKTNRDLQRMIGIRKDASSGQTQADFDREIVSRQMQMRLVRRDAGLFMCQAHFDNGSMSTTANWIPKLLEEQDVDRWKTGLSYLGSRAMEARHQYDEAIEYLKAEGPQQHGNLIRARLLREQVKTRFTKATD
jgi:hypothetical protein